LATNRILHRYHLHGGWRVASEQWASRRFVIVEKG